MCCDLLAVCISNALLFQTLCTPADETPETSSPTGNKKDKKKDEKKDAAKVRFSLLWYEVINSFFGELIYMYLRFSLN